jgi:hypothetical protein
MGMPASYTEKHHGRTEKEDQQNAPPHAPRAPSDPEADFGALR